VTRATVPRGRFSRSDALRLLTKKLGGIVYCTGRIVCFPRINKQILHVLCRSDADASTLLKTWRKLVGFYKHNTIVIVTVVKGSGANDIFD
jgi:hypothetical protein